MAGVRSELPPRCARCAAMVGEGAENWDANSGGAGVTGTQLSLRLAAPFAGCGACLLPCSFLAPAACLFSLLGH